MALLTRYFQVNDSDRTEVFNFVVTKAVTRDFHRDVVSKEFSYRFHRWAVTFTREDKKTLGVFLVWRSPSDNINVTVDVNFTLLNRESFAESRAFSIPRANFRSGYLSNGNGSFIKIAELLTHRPRYVDTNGEFQVELRLGGLETFFERDFFFPRDLSAALADGDDSSNSDGGGGGTGGGPGAQTSGTFLYGAFAFVVTARPRLLLGTWRKNGAVGVAISVARKFRTNSQSLLCRLNFVASVGTRENKLESEVKDESIGPQESTTAWCPKTPLEELYVRRLRDGGMVRVRLDLSSGHAMTEYYTYPCPPASSLEQANDVMMCSGSSSSNSSSAPVHGVDPDASNWVLEADTHSSFLRFSLVFGDIAKIPRNHLRFVQWRSYLVRRSKRWRGHREERETLELVDFQSGNLFSRYYFQDESDQGVMMETTIPTKEVREGVNEFLEDSSCVRVRIQWEFSHQLFQATVHQNDDVIRHHNLQMRLEIANLREKVRELEMKMLRQEEEAKSKEENAARNRRQMVFRGGGSANSSLMALKDSAESSDSSVGSAGISVDNGQQQQSQHNPPHHGLSNKHHRIVKKAILAAQLSLDSQERSRQRSGDKARGRRAAPPASAGGLTLPPPSTSLSTGSLLQQPLSRSPSTTRPNSAALQGERALRRANTIHKQPSVFGGGVSGSCGDVTAPQQGNFKLPLFKVGQADSSDSVEVDDKSAGNNNDGERPKQSTLGCHRHHLDGGGGSGPSDNEGASGRSSLWNSPTLRRVFAPLKQSLSVSAEHIPRPKSPLSNLPWNLKQSAMAKCQSID